MNVDGVLTATAEYDHVHEVRSIGPAIVLVLEREAPLRLDLVYSTQSEFGALKDSARNDPRWVELLDMFFALRAEEEGVKHVGLSAREAAHTDRLASGERMTNLRVTDAGRDENFRLRGG